MSRKKRLTLLLPLFLLALLVSIPCFLTWSELQIEKWNRALIDAVKLNDAKTALTLLEAGANANAREIPSQQSVPSWREWLDRLRGNRPETTTAPTALSIATDAFVGDPNRDLYHENLTLINALLEHGANPNVADEDGFTPLMSAIRNRRKDIVDLLLQHGADVNAMDDLEYTPLQYAVINNDTLTTKRLIQQGANVNALTNMHGTVLLSAVSFRNVEIIRMLLEHHIDPNVQDLGGLTALSMLRERVSADREIMQLLKSYGAKK